MDHNKISSTEELLDVRHVLFIEPAVVQNPNPTCGEYDVLKLFRPMQ